MSAQLALVEALIVAHELAHLATARALGYRPRVRLRGRYCPRISVGIIAPTGGIPRAHDVAIAAAAPLLNIALVLPLAALHLPLAAGGSAILAACSLLPIPHRAQDGWRILQALRRRD